MEITAKFFILILLVVGLNGCTTYNTVQYAQGHPENVAWFTYQTRGTQKNPPPDPKRRPAYYLLTPVTVPVDIVTLPVQFVDYWYVLLSGIGYQ